MRFFSVLTAVMIAIAFWGFGFTTEAKAIEGVCVMFCDGGGSGGGGGPSIWQKSGHNRMKRYYEKGTALMDAGEYEKASIQFRNAQKRWWKSKGYADFSWLVAITYEVANSYNEWAKELGRDGDLKAAQIQFEKAWKQMNGFRTRVEDSIYTDSGYMDSYRWLNNQIEMNMNEARRLAANPPKTEVLDLSIKQPPHTDTSVVDLRHQKNVIYVKSLKNKETGMVASPKAGALLDALEFGKGDWEASVKYLEDWYKLDTKNLPIRDALNFAQGMSGYWLPADERALPPGYKAPAQNDKVRKLAAKGIKSNEANKHRKAYKYFRKAHKLSPDDLGIRDMMNFSEGLWAAQQHID